MLGPPPPSLHHSSPPPPHPSELRQCAALSLPCQRNISVVLLAPSPPPPPAAPTRDHQSDASWPPQTDLRRVILEPPNTPRNNKGNKRLVTRGRVWRLLPGLQKVQHIVAQHPLGSSICTASKLDPDGQASPCHGTDVSLPNGL